jgi:N-acetylglutamate synthase-like GNAT family acetyltransferase
MNIRKATQNDNPRCLEIAKGLPEWFDEKGIKDIAKDLATLPTYVYDDGNVLGYICINHKSDKVIEIAQFAVEKDHQRIGVGSALLEYVENELSNNRIVEVKTLDESCDYEPYVLTRAFYSKHGFVRIEVVDPYPGWSPGNPCAIYVKVPQNG